MVKSIIVVLLLAVSGLNADTIICFHGNGSGGKWGNERTEAGQFVADMHGHGYLVVVAKSKASKWSPMNSASNRDIVSVLAQVQKQSAKPPFFLVGHSNGGAFATRFAVYSGLPIEAVQLSNSSGIREILASDAYQARTLFCYSVKDRTVKSRDVLASAKALESKGVQVETLDLSAEYDAGRYRDNHEFLNTSAETEEFFAK